MTNSEKKLNSKKPQKNSHENNFKKFAEIKLNVTYLKMKCNDQVQTARANCMT